MGEKHTCMILTATRAGKSRRNNYDITKVDMISHTHTYTHTGWWMVDVRGMMGWAPAKYLVPVDDDDLEEEEDNEIAEKGEQY